MLQPEQLIIGVAAGLMLSTMLRFGPTVRELMAAVAAAGLIDYALHSPALNRLAGNVAVVEIPVYPHVCPCVALTFIGILAVLHVLRKS